MANAAAGLIQPAELPLLNQRFPHKINNYYHTIKNVNTVA